MQYIEIWSCQRLLQILYLAHSNKEKFLKNSTSFFNLKDFTLGKYYLSNLRIKQQNLIIIKLK